LDHKGVFGNYRGFYLGHWGHGLEKEAFVDLGKGFGLRDGGMGYIPTVCVHLVGYVLPMSMCYHKASVGRENVLELEVVVVVG
jgi:hypothetical protein